LRVPAQKAALDRDGQLELFWCYFKSGHQVMGAHPGRKTAFGTGVVEKWRRSEVRADPLVKEFRRPKELVGMATWKRVPKHLVVSQRNVAGGPAAK
jgi:hypothetical protein